jgi:hypothetical protein
MTGVQTVSKSRAGLAATGGTTGFQLAGGMQGILEQARNGTRKGPTMDAASLKKLGLASFGGVKPADKNKSQGSSRTKRTGTGTQSKKSNKEDDYENLDIDQIEIKIEEAERDIKTLQAQLRKEEKKSMPGLKNAKDQKMAPLILGLSELRKMITELLCYKDQKIPFYEKLPKDNQFCKHFMQTIQFKRMKEQATLKAEEDRMLFRDATEKLMREQQNANSTTSPTGVARKRMLYQ